MTEKIAATTNPDVELFLLRFAETLRPAYCRQLYYAAMPLVITPELLHYLRNTFVRDAPWVAEADLLLADSLFEEKNYEQYVMALTVRDHLLRTAREHLGMQNMQNAARLIVHYIYCRLPQLGVSTAEVTVQSWAALLYIDEYRDNVVSDIIQTMQSLIDVPSLVDDYAGRAIFGSMAEIIHEVAPLLKDYPELVGLALLTQSILHDEINLTMLPTKQMNSEALSTAQAALAAPSEKQVDQPREIVGFRLPSLTTIIGIRRKTDIVQRRLDIALPEQATLAHPFSLAVAVSQITSQPFDLADMPVADSSNMQLDWPSKAPFVRLRVQVLTPECEIIGNDTHSIRLRRNRDSGIFYFFLTPIATGRISIIVRLYQEEDLLSSALAYTTVGEHVVSEVKVHLRSTELFVKDDVANISRTTSPFPDQRPIKILFLTANQLDTAWLRASEEARAIDQALRQAEYRILEIVVQQAVRINDLQEHLLRHQPDIVHFSGQGTVGNELILHNGNGQPMPVPGRLLRAFFGILKDNIRCVVLNACYSEEQAAGLAEVIDCVVGIKGDVADEASVQFATAFYRSLGYGRSVQEAFSLGRVQIELAGLGDAEKVLLLERIEGVANYIFVSSPSAETTTGTTPLSKVTQHVGGNSTGDGLYYTGRNVDMNDGAFTKRDVYAINRVLANTSGALTEQDILLTLLAKHEQNLLILQRQLAIYAVGEQPLRLLNQIAYEEAEITKLKSQFA